MCTHPPCTDEPRIPLEVRYCIATVSILPDNFTNGNQCNHQHGERVRVTRWKKYWLYGDKVQEEAQVLLEFRMELNLGIQDEFDYYQFVACILHISFSAAHARVVP